MRMITARADEESETIYAWMAPGGSTVNYRVLYHLQGEETWGPVLTYPRPRNRSIVDMFELDWLTFGPVTVTCAG